MAASEHRPDISLRHPRVPEHVVYRGFVEETIVLNLESGTYHGLNAAGGRILETLVRSTTVEEAIATLSLQFNDPPNAIEADVHAFCVDLVNRGLLHLDADDSG